MRYTTAKFPPLLLTTLALSLVLTACNKSNSPTETTVTTSSTTTTEIVEVASTAQMTASPASGVTATSAPALTSATATTDLQMANVGNPKDSVKNVMDGLRTGRVTYAMGFLLSDNKNLKKDLVSSLANYKDIKSIKYAEPIYNDDKTQAVIKTFITLKSSKTPVEVPYLVQKTMTGWKMIAQVAPQTSNPALSTPPHSPANPAPIVIQTGKGKTPQMMQNGKPIKQRTDDVATTKTMAGTPEDALKHAMNAMIKAPASEAVTFYTLVVPEAPQKPVQNASKAKNKPVKENPAAQADKLVENIAMQQALFQQTLQSVKIGSTQYNKDKTEAVVSAVFTPYAKTGSKPQDMEIKMKKVNDEWKIVAETN